MTMAIMSYPDRPCYLCGLVYPRAKNVRLIGKVSVCQTCARVHLGAVDLPRAPDVYDRYNAEMDASLERIQPTVYHSKWP